MRRIVVFLNPRASSARPRELRPAIRRLNAARDDIAWDVRELVPGADIEQFVERALAEGCDTLVAAGGDGTVSAVACAAVGSGVPIGVIPMGAGDVLAEQLGIPGDLDDALEVIADARAVRHLDAMEVEGRLALLNIGAGVSAAVVRETPSIAKKVFGRLAYFTATLIESMRQKPQEFRLVVDGRERSIRCLEVLAINAGLTKQQGVPGFPVIEPDDGAVDVLLMWTPTLRAYLAHAKDAIERLEAVDANVQWISFSETLRMESERPVAVQADGDLIGKTPVDITLRRGLIPVIVPGERD